MAQGINRTYRLLAFLSFVLIADISSVANVIVEVIKAHRKCVVAFLTIIRSYERSEKTCSIQTCNKKCLRFS